MSESDQLAERGWVAFPFDQALLDWVHAARPIADEILSDPKAQERWLRCGGTWFAGVNIFPNDHTGAVSKHVPALECRALSTALSSIGADRIALDPAQISVCYPGYPQPSEQESEANFRFRRDRDAAHVDGLLRDENRRRALGEVHGFVLGIPLNDVPEGASPLVVFEGSHHLMRKAFAERLAGLPPEDWSTEDLTETYVTTRKQAFDECHRIAIHAQPGEAYLVHRLALHGVAPWTAGTESEPRIIAYFRPDPFPGAKPDWWLNLP
ncbi:MAG: hypothetical protein AAGC81_12485 [Pseudomonadota bacterium]